MLIVCKADIRAPTAPVLGTPTAVSSSSLSIPLTTAATDSGSLGAGVASYSLERATSVSGTYAIISSAATFPYVDTGLTASTTYYYRAQATDNSGNVGNYSAIVSATTNAASSGSSYTSNDAAWSAMYTARFNALTYSSTKYVATTGSNSNAGTSVAPYATVAYALSQVGANARIIVKDGSYTVGTTGWVNDFSAGGAMSIPSGTGSNYTVIQAENLGGATITQSSAVYYSMLIGLNSAQRVWIDGFNLVLDTASDMLAGWDLGNNNRLTRCMVRHVKTDTYRNVFVVGVGSLVQDCASYGAGRYMWFTGSASGNSNAGSNVFRRVVTRMDWAIGDQPIATYAHYGSDSAAWVDSKNTLYANCIDIDGPGMSGAGSFGYKWGSFYHPKHQRDIRHKGCIVLNAGAQHASFRGDNIGSPTLSAENCAIWDNDNQSTGSPAGYEKSNGTFTVNDCFGGQIMGADTNGTTGNLRNRFTDTTTNIVQKVGGNGADILYAHGAFLTTWGETDFDNVSTMPLWPWPYEDRIKAWMDTQITKVGAYVPASPTSSRQSFQGTSLGGLEQTLTRRILECSGTVTPDIATFYPAPSVGNSTSVIQRNNITTANTPTPAFDTTTGFLFAAIGRGVLTDHNTAVITDNAGNTLALSGSTHAYGSQYPNSGTGCFFKANATGRTGCIITSTKPTAFDEVTLIALNILNATQIESSSWVYRTTGPTNVATDITVTRPSVLIAVWAGNSDLGENNPQVSSGWTRRQFSTFTNGEHVQMALATREVTAGTYGITWTPAISQGAQLYLFGVN